MKTQNNTTKITGSLIALAMTFILSMSAVAATDDVRNKPEATNDGKTSKVDSLHMQELLSEMSVLDKEEIVFPTSSAVDVYDANDQLIFSGTMAEWNNTENHSTTILKRKAELLFELEDASVYKVF